MKKILPDIVFILLVIAILFLVATVCSAQETNAPAPAAATSHVDVIPQISGLKGLAGMLIVAAGWAAHVNWPRFIAAYRWLDAEGGAFGVLRKITIGSKKVVAVTTLAIAFLMTGCVSAIKHGDIVSITERGFGVEVAATSSTTQTPTIRAGYFSTTIQIIPTSTNSISSPNFANTVAIGNTGVPFSLAVTESTASGNYQTGNAASRSNTISSQPIVPK